MDTFEALGKLMGEVEEALEFIDKYRDTETDPTSDIGEQVPNKACQVYHYLKEAYDEACEAYDRAAEDRYEYERSADYKRQLRMKAQEDMQ